MGAKWIFHIQENKSAHNNDSADGELRRYCFVILVDENYFSLRHDDDHDDRLKCSSIDNVVSVENTDKYDTDNDDSNSDDDHNDDEFDGPDNCFSWLYDNNHERYFERSLEDDRDVVWQFTERIQRRYRWRKTLIYDSWESEKKTTPRKIKRDFKLQKDQMRRESEKASKEDRKQRRLAQRREGKETLEKL